MTYLRDEHGSAAAGWGAAEWGPPEDSSGGDLSGRRQPEDQARGAHSSDHAGSGQYTYQRPDDWTPRSRRRYADPADEPTAETPVDWWATAAERSAADSRDAAAARSFSWREQDPYRQDPYNQAERWDAPPQQQTSYQRGEGSAWDADALRAAAGVPYRENHRPAADYLDDRAADDTASITPVGRDADDTAQFAAARTDALPPVPHAYGIPGQRRPFEPDADVETELRAAPGGWAPSDAAPVLAPTADAEVPIAPPAEAKRSLPRKHLILRIAAVMVLVFSAAIGVAVTVLRDTDPDTVQVKEELQADAPITVATPGPNTSDEQDKPVGAELAQKQEQQQALDAAKSRAADKAEAAQKKAAEEAERAEDERASRSAERSSENDGEGDGDSSSGGNSGDPVPTAPVDCNSYSGNKKTGCALLSEYGFSTSQMSCLDKLWMKESGWRTTAENPSSGAYGIPQSLPGSKMATVASDWRTNPATQIRWGLNYIKGRYGTPCGAWSHSQANGWY
ncbi:hypothetical protein SAMN05443668_105255 [Cryptosporangium aurantiacum]|uniref:Transglycosylase SLT domain-containing protein n=1 Tax=Cryptosporangium aurantiacum TaxID=134849 RepID=A0A1M7QS17_9ACTN|nr:lytic transglycosylase domain-containing protein [Cryptosporangium aurantiacum]SHN34355.1 hypothetical protein SAMN05443668_105255 [Cryptosporangium aurantiacum]